MTYDPFDWPWIVSHQSGAIIASWKGAEVRAQTYDDLAARLRLAAHFAAEAPPA